MKATRNRKGQFVSRKRAAKRTKRIVASPRRRKRAKSRTLGSNPYAGQQRRTKRGRFAKHKGLAKTVKRVKRYKTKALSLRNVSTRRGKRSKSQLHTVRAMVRVRRVQRGKHTGYLLAGRPSKIIDTLKPFALGAVGIIGGNMLFNKVIATYVVPNLPVQLQAYGSELTMGLKLGTAIAVAMFVKHPAARVAAAGFGAVSIADYVSEKGWLAAIGGPAIEAAPVSGRMVRTTAGRMVNTVGARSFNAARLAGNGELAD